MKSNFYGFQEEETTGKEDFGSVGNAANYRIRTALRLQQGAARSLRTPA
jgi:hypothetical protein